MYTYIYEINVCSVVKKLLAFCACVLQAANKNVAKVPPPVPSKPKQINLPYFGQTNPSPSDIKPDGSPQQLSTTVASIGNKPRAAGQQPRVLLSPGVPAGGPDQTVIPACKQESPPAAAVRPFTPQPSKDALLPAFRRPQTVAASSIYSMYTQHQAPGKNFQQAVQSALTKTHPRGPPFSSGKVLGLLRTYAGDGCKSCTRAVCEPHDLSLCDPCLCSESFVSLWLLFFTGRLK